MRKALWRKHLLESFQRYTIVRWCSLIKVSLIKHLLHVLCGVKHLSHNYMNKDQTLHLAFFLLDGKNLFTASCSGTSTGLLLHTLNTMKLRGGENNDRSANNSRKLVSEIILCETQQRQCIYCWYFSV